MTFERIEFEEWAEKMNVERAGVAGFHLDAIAAG